MKLLLVADLHYTLPQLDWVLKVAAEYDLVVISGDLLELSSMVDPEAQIVVVLAYLKRIRARTRLIVCSGNHDLDVIGANGERQAGWLSALADLDVPADGETITIGDADFTLCPWWDGPLTLAEIGAQIEAARTQRRGRQWIWVNHAPPSGSQTSWNGSRSYGDRELAEWVERFAPQMVLSGHVHEAPFSRNGSWVDRIGETWLFNAGRQIGPTPCTVAIDLVAGEAAWFSLEGAETVRLDKPLVRPLDMLTAMPAWMAPRLPAGA
ncbi:Predicted phosphoesterase [Devosia enhydra]|uniref:Predicted phosphoesterase n=1 Tax=Devosia enhydra TaxID=665118 RepID=A0A1K2HYT5_9HYPH|nr:metallophosphoesterase [Devosia enhydra]SFZ85235.1 Predicted phosphoesterase [Devosia enhydra]